MDALIDQVRQGNRRAIAQLMTRLENDNSFARLAIKKLYSETGQAHIVGITGPPGSGKSTLVNELAKAIRLLSLTVGIVAVDPSSPFTGGALLGDRVRMRDLAGDEGVFIRSMASRGSLGGIARSTANVVKILDAAGYDLILIETIGAGQAEVDIASTAHTTVVVEAPGMGDDIQTIKAGILEIADVLVVNKADRAGSARSIKALKAMLRMGYEGERTIHHGQTVLKISNDDSRKRNNNNEEWSVPVLATIATEGEGVHELVQVILAHKIYLDKSGFWQAREMNRCWQEIDRLLQEEYISRMKNVVPVEEREQLLEAVANRQIDPYTAVDQLICKMEEIG